MAEILLLNRVLANLLSQVEEQNNTTLAELIENFSSNIKIFAKDKGEDNHATMH